MMILINAIFITLAQIPGIILRYLPFHSELDKRKRKLLFNTYIIFFIIEIIGILILIGNFHMDIFTFKKIMILGGYIYVAINCIIIKSRFFQHMFIMGMQAIYTLFLHSLVAFIQSYFFSDNPIYYQLFLQSVLYIILFIITLYPVVKILKNTFAIYIKEDMSYYWNILWIIPFCLFYSDIILTMNGEWINTFNQLVSRTLTLITAVVIFKCTTLDFTEKKSKIDVVHNNQLLKLQVSDLNNQFQVIQKNKENLSILKHDMRHRLYLIKTLINEGNYEEVDHIMNNWNNNLEETNIVSFCKNPTINASLSAYIEKAKKHNIEVKTNIDLPSHLNIDDADLAVVILNLTENALNASLKSDSIKKGDLKEKIIEINSRYSDNTLVFRLRNKFYGHVDFDEDDLPITTAKNHGIGMRSVKAFTEKYNAHVSCTFEDNWFTVVLFIKE